MFLFQPSEKNFRFYVKVRTALNINPESISQELQLVFGDKIPSNLTIEKWSNYYQKKERNEKQSRESSTEEVCSLIDNTLHTNQSKIHTVIVWIQTQINNFIQRLLMIGRQINSNNQKNFYISV